ncbi:MAG: DUF1801 domain-containing protein [Eubacteriaceae bacterium]
MGTSVEFIEYVCDQIEGIGSIRYRKMFGEYMVYVNDKPVLLVCDNVVYVKQLESIAEKMKEAPKGFPYNGAKEHYILEIDNREFSQEIILMLEKEIPIPKPRKPKKKINMKEKTEITTIDAYIDASPKEFRPLLEKIREVIKNEAPEAKEKISYGMPTFYLMGNLVHFAIQKKHLGFYPTPSGINKFKDVFENMGLKYSKGAVQFPLDKEIPFELIKEIVQFRVEENKK